MNKDTQVVRGHLGCDPHTGAVSFPIYQSATFRHHGLHQSTGYDYSRTQNPTREELEKTIARLEQGAQGFAFSTGMAAVSAVIGLLAPGDQILVSDDLYGGTYRILEEIYRPYGIDAVYVDTQDLQCLRQAITPRTRALLLETPSNPTMKVTDIAAAVAIAREAGLLTIVDNTFLTPYYQRPLTLGADIVLHSATKYLGGHNDTLAGLVVTATDTLGERVRFIQNAAGAVLSPFDSWLILRGIKTLGVRLRQQEVNAGAIARWLKTHPDVAAVHYPGLSDHPGHAVAKRQSEGFGAMISFVVRDAALAAQVLNSVKLILFAESLGGVETLITYPLTQTHAAIPEAVRNRSGVNDCLLRLSVGIEDAGDLIADLEQALKREE